MEEIEVKFLNINIEEIEAKLKNIGAKKVFDKIYKIRIFDYPDLRLNDRKSWLRLRDEGDKVTVAFKRRLGVSQVAGVNDQGMEELEVVVDNFDRTSDIFLSLGLMIKFYEEKRRIRYILDEIEFDIDLMPALDPFLEIESSSWENVDRGIKLLGLNPEDKKIFSASQIYALKGIKMLDYIEFKFDGLIKRNQN
ncbi:MAG: class IV adenylate cyclase [Patescibacteria group bacterium]|jgi:adenylate cyclase class 2